MRNLWVKRRLCNFSVSSAEPMSGGRRSRGDDPGGSSVRVPDMRSGRPDRLPDAELSSPLAPTFLSNRFRSGLGNAAENRIKLDLSFFADRYRAQRPCRPTIKVDDGAAGMTVRFFDIRPAPLETDARNSMEPFACWREANASKYRNELRLYDLVEKEISRRLTPLPTHHGLDQATLDVFDTQFRDRQNKAIIDFGLTRGVVVGDLLRELGTDSSTAISSVRQLRKYLLDVGVTVLVLPSHLFDTKSATKGICGDMVQPHLPTCAARRPNLFYTSLGS